MPTTEWFNGDVKPVHEGVYQRRQGVNQMCYSYWNNMYWGFSENSVEDAVIFRDFQSFHQSHPWRGLTEKQK